ncbi:MAG TPA: chromate efflux transporter [Gemmatimonadaceae bacterium]
MGENDRDREVPGRDVGAAGAPAPERTSLGELARLFLKLGTIAFGGPAAHVAMMEDEVVRRRGWLTRGQFLDYLGATNLIPGPNSTELAIHVGHARAGWAGLLVAGSCFILPAALLVGVIAWAYVRYGTLPQVAGLLYGVKPVVIAVVLQALWRLGRSAVRSPTLAALAVAATVASALGVNELAILAGAGAGMALLHGIVAGGRRGAPRWGALLATVRGGAPGTGSVAHDPAVVAASAGAATLAAAPFGLWSLFAVFVKIGAVLFGSGYVLLAFLRADLVERLHWLTEQQLLDAVAVGQVTPGPVFTTATFVGYVLGGAGGAAVATLGIFLPAFVFVALSGPLVPRLRRSPTAAAVLDGVNVASLALMAVVTWQLGRAALVDPLTVVLAALAGVLLLRFRVNSAWLVLGGAVVGLLA